ncbi:outer membrane receptor protein involved in Fe transport [Mucilaginibacter gracilis]|uniref:Outer membrane receptor protein involved in Fe transport n=1 Tax=Mucilaginibacter gracilis TaxID=423350 RepID=A0A495IV09_9SPHI|nr:outer membrane beta-barrel family protein [Mucilaginibacter gracilis]RKR80550.1 outer membrane receptor protein involved in Fe transport [Mucilaginibacter gracilis]
MGLLLLVSTMGYSQSIIKGNVVDQQNQAIPNVTVTASKDNHTLVIALTDKNGNYTITLSGVNTFRLSFRSVGYKSIDTILTDVKSTLINTKLYPENISLSEVAISGKKPIVERKIDRIVFNVENSLASKGGDALDVLKASPGISVETDQISMIAKSHLRLMVDNVFIQLSGEDLINFLKTISSESIKDVEIISNPPAKYDAAGNSGIININLKKQRLNSWNAAVRGSMSQATFTSGTSGTSFDYNRGPLSFYVNANYSLSVTKRTEGDQFFYPEELWNSDYNKKFNSRIFSGRVGFDYKFSKSYTMGIQYLGSLNKPLTIENSRINITNNATGKLDSIVISAGNNNRNINNSSVNWHHNIKFDSLGKKMDINFDYLNYGSDLNRNFTSVNYYDNLLPTNNSLISKLYTGQQNIHNYSGRIDFEIPFPWGSLSYGAKASFSNTKNNILTFDQNGSAYILDKDQSNLFDYTENTQALYISANKKLSKRWFVQAGLRTEHTTTTGNSITLSQVNKNNYTYLFPTIYLSYNPDQSNSFVLDFGRRIDRPSFIDINPFRFYSSAYSYSEGNPLLKPMFGHTLTLTHTYKYNLSTSLYYSLETNGYDEIPSIDAATNTQYFTMQNYYTAHGMGIIENYTFNKYKWWESNLFGFLWYGITKFKQNVGLPENNGFGAHISANNSFLIDSKSQFKAEVDVSVHTSKRDLVYRKNGYSTINAGVSYPVLNKKLDVTLMAYDIFRTDTRNFTTTTDMIKQNYYSYNDNRMIRISLSYKFGNKKINVKKQNFGNEDEIGRLQK